MPRSGRPLASPLTTRLSHAQTAIVRRVARQKGVTIYRLLGDLLRHAIQHDPAYAREFQQPPVETAFHQLGYVPKPDPLTERNRPRENGAAQHPPVAGTRD